MGTLLSISANSWFTSWLGLEINLLRVIPLILNKLEYNSTESCIKYFLPQAIASLILIFWTSVSLLTVNIYFIELNEYFIIASLLIKAGAAPLHFWFPQVIENCPWFQCLILFTWQKIAPTLLLRYFISNILIILSITSAIVGILGGLNQNKIKIILTYSSISHLGWIILATLFSIQTWLFYFLAYSVISLTIVWFVLSSGVRGKINEINFWAASTINKYIFVLSILSLGGIPPLLGFSAKLLILILLLKTKIIIAFIFLITRSLISLYFYCRLFYSSIIAAPAAAYALSPTNTPTIILWGAITITINILIPFVVIIL